MDNLYFYQNKICSKSKPGFFVEDILKWKRNYKKLEDFQSYIKWLFPLPDDGGVQPLTEHEAIKMRSDKSVQKMMLKAYEMMLDFFGMEMRDSSNGIVSRSANWKGRYNHLNRSQHGYVCISRIIQALGELGFERFQTPFVDLLVTEVVLTRELRASNDPWLIKWINSVKYTRDREILLKRAFGSGICTLSDIKSEGGEITIERDSYGVNEDETINDRENEQKVSMNSLKVPKGKDAKSDYSFGQRYKGTVKGKLNAVSVNKCNPSNCRNEDVDINLTKSVSHGVADNMLNTNCGGEVDGRVCDGINGNVRHEQKLTRNEGKELHTKGNKTDNFTEHTYKVYDQQRPEETRPNRNLLFYRNEIFSSPAPGFTIEMMLKHHGDHMFFDNYPSFICWLFPSRNKSSVNDECQVLYDYEAKEIRRDSLLSDRVLEAYKTVLDFFGMKLVDDIGGKVTRIPGTYKGRYRYISRHPGNYLGITRVLTSLGELGYERFQVPLIDFLITEGYDNKMFDTLQTKDIEHWIGSIKDDGEKYTMVQKYKRIFDDVHSDDEMEQNMAGLQIKSNSTCDKDMR